MSKRWGRKRSHSNNKTKMEELEGTNEKVQDKRIKNLKKPNNTTNQSSIDSTYENPTNHINQISIDSTYENPNEGLNNNMAREDSDMVYENSRELSEMTYEN